MAGARGSSSSSSSSSSATAAARGSRAPAALGPVGNRLKRRSMALYTRYSASGLVVLGSMG
jgi:hypothetical protein